MTAFIENIRKMMGWCPNVSMMEARKSVQFDDLAVNAPGGELTHNTANWWNKYRNRILVNSFIITVISVYFLAGSGENIFLRSGWQQMILNKQAGGTFI